MKITLNGSTIPLITKEVEATSVPMMNEEVSDQYAGIIFELENGSLVVGRLINEDEDIYILFHKILLRHKNFVKFLKVK